MYSLRPWKGLRVRMLHRLTLAALLVAVTALELPIPAVHAAEAVIATVNVGHRPWQVSVNPNTDRIYVTNHVTNTVSVIDGSTNTVVNTIALSNPYNVYDVYTIGLNPSTNRIYVLGLATGIMWVIDGSTDTVLP